MTSKPIYALQLQTSQDFDQNLSYLCALLEGCESDSFVLAPEVVLTGFCYDYMPQAALFAKKATTILAKHSMNKAIILSLIERVDDKAKEGFVNAIKVFYHGEVIHKQHKYKLFAPTKEPLHFHAGLKEQIKPFWIGNICCGALNCFELRFVELWQKLRGCDIIFVCAQWGKGRKEHFEALSQALAIANNCFVVASNGAGADMARSSAIITPWGRRYHDDNQEIIMQHIDLTEIARAKDSLGLGL